MKRACLLILVMIFPGCMMVEQERYAGAISGSAAIAGDYSKQYAYVFQFNVYHGIYNEGKRKPLFAVFWIKSNGAESSITSDNRNLIKEINGHLIAPSLSQKAIYALQPDYHLQEIPLQKEEIDYLFEALRSGNLVQSKNWQSTVVPKLQLVDK